MIIWVTHIIINAWTTQDLMDTQAFMIRGHGKFTRLSHIGTKNIITIIILRREQHGRSILTHIANQPIPATIASDSAGDPALANPYLQASFLFTSQNTSGLCPGVVYYFTTGSFFAA